jgi:hypothetical protein
MSALAELRAAYRERNAEAARWRAGGGTVVGYVGADVPRELIEAAGHFALRLASVDVDPRRADRILGPGVDEATRLLLAGLLEGAYPIDRLVLCHDDDHTVRLYTALRMLDLPGVDLWFLDLLHQPRASTDAYDRARLRELAAWLGDTSSLPDSIAAANRSRALGDRLQMLRRAGGVSGADALALLGAGTALPASVYAALLDAALADLDHQGSGRSVLLLGSDHDRDDVYAAVDELGAIVVAETHGFGEALLAGRVEEEGDPLDALVRHYRPRPRTTPAAADVQIAWVRRGDESRAWSLPAEQRRLGAPIVTLRSRPYRLDDASRKELQEALA